MNEYFADEKIIGEKVLDLLVLIAVFVVTIFFILEFLGPKMNYNIIIINQIYFWVSIVIFIIFLVDLIRLWKHSEGAKDFFTNNWLDVIATIPFGLLVMGPVTSILKIARVATRISKISKLSKASKASKISKQFKTAAHFKRESEDYQKKHRL